MFKPVRILEQYLTGRFKQGGGGSDIPLNASPSREIPPPGYDYLKLIFNKKYVLWNVYLPNALHSVCLDRLSCTEVGIYNGANSLNGFLTPAVA